jgi:hypothetical protein
MRVSMWFVWAGLLILQNFAFTAVSRARNSGSLRRHMIAAIFSNGICFVGQVLAVDAFMKILSGKFGIRQAIFAGVFYTAFTLLGSLAAHQYALKTEKGKSSVGANSKYAQIPVEELAKVKRHLGIAIVEPAKVPVEVTLPEVTLPEVTLPEVTLPKEKPTDVPEIDAAQRLLKEAQRVAKLRKAELNALEDRLYKGKQLTGVAANG